MTSRDVSLHILNRAIRSTDGPDLSFRLQVKKLTQGFVNRRCGVLPVCNVVIDVICAKPFQALLQLVPYGVGAKVAVNGLVLLREEIVTLLYVPYQATLVDITALSRRPRRARPRISSARPMP